MGTRLDELSVADIMASPVITVKPDELLTRADLDMRVADVRHLPVVDERGRLVGILSNRDVLKALGKSRRRSVRVRDVMSEEVHRVNPRTSAREAAQLLLFHRIGALPVVGDDLELVGIVTETDFLRIAVQALGGRDAVTPHPHPDLSA